MADDEPATIFDCPNLNRRSKPTSLNGGASWSPTSRRSSSWPSTPSAPVSSTRHRAWDRFVDAAIELLPLLSDGTISLDDLRELALEHSLTPRRPAGP